MTLPSGRGHASNRSHAWRTRRERAADAVSGNDGFHHRVRSPTPAVGRNGTLTGEETDLIEFSALDLLNKSNPWSEGSSYGGL